jgi:hypothetical protein
VSVDPASPGVPEPQDDRRRAARPSAYRLLLLLPEGCAPTTTVQEIDTLFSSSIPTVVDVPVQYFQSATL